LFYIFGCSENETEIYSLYILRLGTAAAHRMLLRIGTPHQRLTLQVCAFLLMDVHFQWKIEVLPFLEKQRIILKNIKANGVAESYVMVTGVT